MNTPRLQVALLLSLLTACSADAPTPGSPSVSGESHFLAHCAATAECATGLECLCGVCTATCDDDAPCEALAAGAICSPAPACDGTARTCTGRADPSDAALPDAALPDAGRPVECVVPVDGACPADTVRVHTGRRVDRERQCVAEAREVLSCITEAGLFGPEPTSGCVRRVPDGPEFAVDEGDCLPFEFTGCGDDGGFTFDAYGWPPCPAVASAGVCEPRDLGLTLSPTPGLGNVTRIVQGFEVEPDRLRLDVEERHDDGRNEPATYTLTGPFGQLDPAALAGLDRMTYSRHFSRPDDFIVSLYACEHVGFLAVSAHRASLEARFGPVDDLFDPATTCERAPPADACPRDLALRWAGESVPSGRAVSTLATHMRAGRGTGCPGDADADAFVEFLVLPRGDVPTCTGAGAPEDFMSAFALTDAAGRPLEFGEGEDLDRTDEVLVTPDPTDPTHLTLAPVDPAAGFGELHLRAPLGLPRDFAPPILLRQWVHSPFAWNRILELSDTTGLRVAAVSAGAGFETAFAQMTATRAAPTCRMPGPSVPQDFRPLVLTRGDDPPVTADLGQARFAELGLNVDVRASGDALAESCTSDTQGSWVDFVAVWE
jgi:hypothetical protein